MLVTSGAACASARENIWVVLLFETHKPHTPEVDECVGRVVKTFSSQKIAMTEFENKSAKRNYVQLIVFSITASIRDSF